MTARAVTGRPSRVGETASAVKTALLTAPGRPAGRPSPSRERRRIWRGVAVGQACLAVVLCTFYRPHTPWQHPSPWFTLLAVSVPVTLVGLGRPLSAWRCALLVAMLGPVELLLWLPDLNTRYVPLLPAPFLYLVGLAYGRRVLVGAWLSTMVVGSVAAAALAWPGLFMLLRVQPAPGDRLLVEGTDQATVVAALLVPSLAAVLSHNVRARRLATHALAEQELRSTHEQAAMAVLEERARIARELHDVVAHHMSVIAIHAETAPYRVADPPPALTDSFALIRASAVEALTELRRLLVLLRSPDGATEISDATEVERPVTAARVEGQGGLGQEAGQEVGAGQDALEPVLHHGGELVHAGHG